MNRRIGRLGVFLILCYAALFLQLNRVQILDRPGLTGHPANTRAIVRDFNRPRGAIVTADNVVVAESLDQPEGSRFDRLRVYPEGDLFGHVTGFFSFQFGATGVESSYNDELAGQTIEQEVRGLADLFVARENVGDVVLSVRRDAQQAARDALGDLEGSVVALDPRNGEILALWSFPSYDPSVLSSHDLPSVVAARDALLASPGKPLQAHPYQEIYFPGSTFKVVTGSIGLETGVVTPEEPVYPTESSFVPPQTTRPLRNFGGSTCGGTFFEVLADSCNTAFARMALDIGAEDMIEGAEAFGFNDRPPIDLPAPATSVFPTDFADDLPKLAFAGIGQGDVSASPLQMALVAAAVANGGEVMVPHVMREIRDPDGDVFRRFDERVWTRAIDSSTAATMRQAMRGVVEGGTANRMAIPGYEVGGKTGTAQLGTDPPSSHAWIIGFAGLPGQEPSVAVAVLVRAQPGASEQTGGRVAAPIARSVMEVVLAAQAEEGAEGGGD